MKKQITGSEPAMPVYENDHSFVSRDGINSEFILKGSCLTGMTIRQQFSAMAMQGLTVGFDEASGFSCDKAERIAERAVRIADALIAELNK